MSPYIFDASIIGGVVSPTVVISVGSNKLRAVRYVCNTATFAPIILLSIGPTFGLPEEYSTPLNSFVTDGSFVSAH